MKKFGIISVLALSTAAVELQASLESEIEALVAAE